LESEVRGAANAALFYRVYAVGVSRLLRMAFVRKKVKVFSWPVNIEEPSDGGTFDTVTFDAKFKRVGRKEFQKLGEKGELDLLKVIMVGWEGIQDEDGKELPFSIEAMRDLSDDPYWIRGVLKAYTETFEGARQGN
jgi:hypothetical protein